MFCPNCGNNVPDNSSFCIMCGSPLTQPVMPQPVMPQPMMQQPMMQQPMMQPQKKSKAPWIILGISIAALIAIIVTIVILLFACNKDDISSKNTSVKAVVTSFFDSLENRNKKTFDNTMYPILLTMNDEDYDSLYGEICDEFYEELEYICDDDVKTFNVNKITIKYTDEASESDMDYVNTTLSEYDGYKKMNYGATVAGYADVTINGEQYTINFEFEVVGCNGTYYIFDISDIY